MSTFNIRIAALALASLAAGSAFAESPAFPAVQATASTAERAVVQAQARTVGLLTEADLQRAEAPASQLTRAEVQAETRAAAARGELGHAGEVAVLQAAPVVLRITAGPVMAALTR